jgi:carbon-monoxide dehydrogenase medium subunit
VPGSAGFHAATSIEDALAALDERKHEGAVLAGGTWIMRARLRGERQTSAFVAISGIDALRRIEVTQSELQIGAAATHAELARFLAPLGEFRALRQAAANSANPAVRNMATVGGNLCATDFAAADLVPALLCLEAQVELRQGSGEPQRMPMPAFLAARKAIQAGTLLTRVMVPRRQWRSAHIRLPLRKAGDYPVAIVSAACAVTEDGSFSSPRIAVGSVETVAMLWSALERKLDGRPPDPTAAAKAAAEAVGEMTARDGEEAPGWYRLKVLPTLVRRAVEQLEHAI